MYERWRRGGDAGRSKVLIIQNAAAGRLEQAWGETPQTPRYRIQEPSKQGSEHGGE